MNEYQQKIILRVKINKKYKITLFIKISLRENYILLYIRISESINSNLIYSTTKFQMKIFYSLYRYIIDIQQCSNYCYNKTHVHFFLALPHSFSVQRKRKNSIKSINKELISIGKKKKKHKDPTILFLPSKQITP